MIVKEKDIPAGWWEGWGKGEIACMALVGFGSLYFLGQVVRYIL